jgi:hypothetical protein
MARKSNGLFRAGQMARPSPRRAARNIDWDKVLAVAGQEITDRLKTNEEFKTASTLRAQIVIAHRLLHIEHTPTVPPSMIGKFFGMSKNGVKDHLNNYKRFGEDAGRCGRPPILPVGAHEALIQHIIEAQATGRPCTMADLKQVIMNTWQEDMDSGTIWRSLDRDPRIKA